MKQIFSGMKVNNKLSKDLVFKDWLYSKKKEKHYSKITTINYMFIGFKNGYVIIFEKDGEKLLMNPIRDYYHTIKNWVISKIKNPIWIPF